MSSYLGRNKIDRKKFGGPNFEPNRPKLGLKLGFLPFSEVLCISFLGNCIGDSLEQCPTTTIGKIHEKNFGAKIGPGIRFFAIFLSLFH